VYAKKLKGEECVDYVLRLQELWSVKIVDGKGGSHWVLRVWSEVIYVEFLCLQAILATQKRIQQLVPGFRFNLGFSGKYFHHGTSEENLGDDMLLGKRSVCAVGVWHVTSCRPLSLNWWMRRLCTIILKFANLVIQDFDLLWSPILIPLFWPVVTGSDKPGRNHMAGDTASTTDLLLRR
jgi:hypothetical protein